MPRTDSDGPRFRLGLPAWAFPGWKDRYFSDRPSRLQSYARVFNAVEGNTTFYRVPGNATVARWREAVSGTDVEFCFKLPREVTHEPRPDLAVLAAFLDAVVPVYDEVCNGMTMVRLILHPDAASNERYLDDWATRVARRLRDNVAVYMVIHCPNNQHCPPLAQDFHARLRTKAGCDELPPLADWPVPGRQAQLSF